MVVEDNVVSFPAVMASGRPWVRIVSCNPAEVRDALIAPFSSGYPAADPTRWAAFRAEYQRVHADCWLDFDAFCRDHGAGGLGNSPLGPEFMHESPYLNLYAYPAEADYRRAEPLAPTWHRLDSTIRATDGDWSLPEHLADRPGALVYLSLGSLGSADVELMQRLVDVLGRTDHRVIVSKGPLADQIRLHDNMAGEAILPQPAILPSGRPRDHARRQQHGGRELPQREADGGAAAVLGPGRQRAADPRDRVRAAPARPTRSATRT